jgi:hypothetical protein
VVEQLIRNQQAAGSNPAPGSIQNQLLAERRVGRKARLVPVLRHNPVRLAWQPFLAPPIAEESSARWELDVLGRRMLTPTREGKARFSVRGRTEGGRDGMTRVRCTELRGLTEVAVVEAADFCTLGDRARRGELDGPGVRRILVEREMSATVVIVLEVAPQDAA